MNWMLLPLKRYADFSGRSRRKEYWMFVLFQLIVFTALAIVAGITGAFSGGGEGAAAGLGFVFIIWCLFGLALLIPSLAVQVRRFHDQDKSGWMLLLAFVPGVGGLIVLVFMCLEGTRGPNSYGPDPKDPEGGLDEVFA